MKSFDYAFMSRGVSNRCKLLRQALELMQSQKVDALSDTYTEPLIRAAVVILHINVV